MTTNDKNLINQYVRLVGEGDKVALENLYVLIYKPLYSILMKNYPNHHDIQDCINQTITLIVKKSANIKFFTNCYSWIIKIAKNIMRNYYRKTSRREQLLKQFPIATYVKFSEQSSILKIELSNLPEYEKYLIYYRYFCKFTIDEISIIANKSKSTINREINQVLTYLKEKIK